MKIRPQPQDLPFNEEDIDNYGLHIDWVKTGKKNQYKIFQAEQYWFEDDLIDPIVEIETRKQNASPKFTEKIPLSSYDKLTFEEKIAYHKFLQDYRADKLSESKT